MNTVHIAQADDELTFLLVAQRTITQDDVRISVPVTALVSTTAPTADDLDARIRGALNRLVAATWTFSQIQRDGEAVGFERISLTAWARVAQAEVFNLVERARRASEEGLSLGTPDVDYSLPTAKLNAIAHELRGELLSQVRSQLADYARWTGRAWRIGEVVLGSRTEVQERRTRKGLARSEDDVHLSFDSHFDLGRGSSVAGAERVSLVAEVTLRSRPADVQHG